MGQYRDLQIGQVECAAAQYNPVTDEFRTYESVEFDVRFRGGDGFFITSQTLSPFEAASSDVVATTINSAAALQFVKELDLTSRICLGEELLILTNPNFRSPADDLAQWKRDKGITTTVIEVGVGAAAYNTAGEIDDLIERRYDNCVVRPSYVLFIGDSEWIPPARTDYDVRDDATTGSDYGYAIYPHFFLDIFPDFAVGRIPVDTEAEAQRVVDKTIQYESAPPFINFGDGGPFYTTASLASQFQCCRMNQNGSPSSGQPGRTQRSFIHSSEVARNALMAAGHTGQRIYIETVDNGGYCLVNPGAGNPCPPGQVQQPYSGNATPNLYFDSTLLPPDLRSGSGFPWNGSNATIINAFNQGRFLFLHRDHGGSGGWSNPSFNINHLGSLSNGDLLPIVYSVNCKSGYWDRETDTGGSTESFMERMLMLNNGGMVGGLGDVRNSPSWENSALTRGFFDATWPNAAPGFGGPTVHRRLGDILNHGKIYLVSQIGVAQPAGDVSLADSIDEYIMWHAFGDPTLEMWTGNPHRLILPLKHLIEANPEFLRVEYEVEGATITAYQMTKEGMLPVGRAGVSNGAANIRYFVEPDANAPIMLSASLENAVSVLLTPRQEGQPDLVVEELDLGANTEVARGENLENRLRILVGNLGDASGPGTIDALGNPKPGYMIDLVLSRDEATPGGFAVVPLPAGEAFVEDGLLQGGRVSRTPDSPALSSVQFPIGPPISTDVGGVIPTQAPLGELFLCGRIDPGDVVAESNESNNLTCLKVTVVEGGG